MSSLAQKEILKTIITALDSKKAENIELIGVRELTIVADHFIIANGTSGVHARALADEVEFRLRQKGISPQRTEGYQGSTWIILDYADTVVHIFNKETRDFYRLENLWRDGKFEDYRDYL